jgi:hypothetical protein
VEEKEIADQAFEYLTWGLEHGYFVLFSLVGAVCGYLLYSFPESRRIKQVLQSFGLAGSRLARAEFLVTTLMGTFVVATIIQPDSGKAAFLAGFAWLGLLRHFVPQEKG